MAANYTVTLKEMEEEVNIAGAVKVLSSSFNVSARDSQTDEFSYSGR